MRVILWLNILAKSYLQGEAKAVLAEAAVTHTRWRRGFLAFCGLDNIHVLSVFGCDYEVILFFSWPIRDTKQPWSNVDVLCNCLSSTSLSSIVRPVPSNTKALVIVQPASNSYNYFLFLTPKACGNLCKTTSTTKLFNNYLVTQRDWINEYSLSTK